MKKFLIILSFFSLPGQIIIAQPTQAEIDKIVKNAKAEIERFKNDPKNAEIAKKMPAMDSVGRKQKSDNAVILNNSGQDIITTKLPLRNNTALNSLPKRVFSRQELLSFLTSLHSELENKLSPVKVKAAQVIISKLNNDASKIALVGIMAWYKNAPSEAALLLTYAATRSPDDITLNNCGAILNLCGLENKAIPILKYALANQPTNSTLLNNIGQAYAGLGEKDTALYYLMGCIKQSSTHPEGCATVAYIEYEKGNLEKARQYAEQAIEGGYSGAIAKFYKKIKKDANLVPLLDDNLGGNDYFDLNGFSIPQNCRNWDQSEDIYAQQQVFIKKTDALIKQFTQIVKANTHTDLSSLNSVSWKKGPLADVAQEIKSGLYSLYSDAKMNSHMEFLEKLSKTVTDEHADRMALVNKYIPLFKAAEKNPPVYEKLIHQNCLDKVVLDNKWFEIRANLYNKYKEAWMQRDILHYNNMVFLTTLTAPNENIFQSECATYANALLYAFQSYVLQNCNPINKPNCANSDPAKSRDSNSPEFNQAKCPIDIEVPFTVGKLMLNCRRFEFEIGEGIILNFEKNFVTRESTVALGIGVGLHLPVPMVPGKRAMDASVKEQFFIKFDKNNQPSDVGVKWEAEIDFKGVASPEFKTGFTLGVSSGYNFQPGALKGIID